VTDQTRCEAMTKSGTQCKNQPVAGETHCNIHQPEGPMNRLTEQQPPLEGEEIREIVSDLDRMIESLQSRVSGINGASDEPEAEPDQPADEDEGSWPGLQSTLSSFAPKGAMNLLGKARELVAGLSSESLPEGIKGVMFLLSSVLEDRWDQLKRRRKGDYELDPWGMDEEVLDMVRPVFQFLYKYYWRVDTTGVENLPMDGAALLVANHAGVLPWDGAMVATAISEELPVPRVARALYLSWFAQMPFVSSLLTKCGQVLANHENGEKLLREGELVVVFPEGVKGVSKKYKDRYKLQRFGRGGFVKMAIRAQVPIIPVSIIGSEEIMPILARFDLLGKPIGMPFFPLTPTFPWFGPLGGLPYPSKWKIHFHEPIDMSVYEPEDARDFVLVQKVKHQVKDQIQDTLHELLQERTSTFF